jgi:hypothetical protein
LQLLSQITLPLYIWAEEASDLLGDSMVGSSFRNLQRKVSTWAAWSMTDALKRELILEDAEGKLERIAIQASEDSLPYLCQSLEDLTHWHLVDYQHRSLNQRERHPELLVAAAAHARAQVDVASLLIGKGLGAQFSCMMLPDTAAVSLGLCLLAARRAEVRVLFHQLRAGLDTQLLDLRNDGRPGAGTIYRHFWFLMLLCAAAFKERIDLHNYSTPTTMGPYADALASWDTENVGQVDDLVSALAEFHVQQARNRSANDIREFDREDRMIFPYEILGWLRLREWAGRANPSAFSHPLMNQPLAWLPAEPVPAWTTPMLDQALAAAKGF